MIGVTLNILQTIGRDDGELSSKQFIEELRSLPDHVTQINVDINSEGGSVFEGNAIAEALKQHPANVTTRCIGSALSIASVIFLAGDERLIAENGWVMIHEPMADSWGTANEIRQQADLIDGIRQKMVADYEKATCISSEQAEQMMREETWFDSADAIKYGFATGVTGKTRMVAKLSRSKYKNMPTRLIASNADAPCGGVSNQEEKEMSDVKNVGQTIAAIRARCRGAGDQFILAQLEAGTSLEDITAVHNEDQSKELDELKQALAIAEATIAQYEEQMAEEEDEAAEDDATEEAPSEEVEEEKEEEVVMMEEEEEEEMSAKAKGGLRPIATKIRKGSKATTARARWLSAIDNAVNNGMDRQKAMRMVNRNNPGLRSAVIEESPHNQNR